LDNQSAYENIRAYLTRPGARRAAPEGVLDTCKYEIEIDGELHRCAVGCLLAPDTIEALKITNQLGGDCEEVILPFFDRDLSGIDRRLLALIQNVHDTASNWASGEFNPEQLDRVVQTYGLTAVVDAPVQELVPA
jgi:hypothetical protein